MLGAAVSDISEMVIKEIGEAVKEVERQEKKQNRTFEGRSYSEYHNNRNKNAERSNEYGNDIRPLRTDGG